MPYRHRDRLTAAPPLASRSPGLPERLRLFKIQTSGESAQALGPVPHRQGSDAGAAAAGPRGPSEDRTARGAGNCGWAPGPAAGRAAIWSAGCCGLGVCAPPVAMTALALPVGLLCASPGLEHPVISAPRPGPVRFGCSRDHVAGRPGCPWRGAAPPQLPPLQLPLSSLDGAVRRDRA